MGVQRASEIAARAGQKKTPGEGENSRGKPKRKGGIGNRVTRLPALETSKKVKGYKVIIKTHTFYEVLRFSGFQRDSAPL